MPNNPKEPLDPFFAGVDAALKRAAKVAHALARKTKTPCYIWQDGQIVDITAKRKTPAQGGRTYRK
jgi:hypothetical protein